MASSGFDLFGTGVRTKALVAIQALGETHVAELVRVLGVGATTVRNAVETLERASVVVGTPVGGMRMLMVNPRFRAHAELVALLDALLLTDRALLDALAAIRRRPRRRGKEL